MAAAKIHAPLDLEIETNLDTESIYRFFHPEVFFNVEEMKKITIFVALGMEVKDIEEKMEESYESLLKKYRGALLGKKFGI